MDSTCRATKRVTFAEGLDGNGKTMEIPPVTKEISQELHRVLFCQRDELALMKERVRHTILCGKANDDDETSGLGRYTFERSQHKRNALFHIISAYREYSHDHEYIRYVSERCTAWAVYVAKKEADDVNYDVYGDPLDNLLQTSTWEQDLDSFNNSFGKRALTIDTASDLDDDCSSVRNVRPRLLPPTPSTPIAT
eukprot:Nitzschia sp. Nitz4//scaffold111_size72815//63357//63941//NITZ4_005799-RA/size72815-processed-gene-0.73-mRNA-1//-1//CDS//3329533207//3011//frame0